MTTIKLTRPLPAGYTISIGPSGAESVAAPTGRTTQTFYTAGAWAQIEKGRGLWRNAHDAIFGRVTGE